jgi:hypothetical protein
MNVRSLRAFLRELMDSRIELAIPFASAVLILLLSDLALMTALSWLAPALHGQAAAVPDSTRRWMIGVPAAAVYLALAIRRLWLAFRA